MRFIILHSTLYILHSVCYRSAIQPIAAKIYNKKISRGKTMKKLNKKGFTLIEMLVVIAIIAILVAIIIPTVTSATTKAKAATDAANLRSAKAEITIKVLDGTWAEFSNGKESEALAKDLGIPGKAKSDGSSVFTATVTTDGGTGATIVVKYGDNDIEHYAKIAGGTDSSSSEEKTEKP